MAQALNYLEVVSNREDPGNTKGADIGDVLVALTRNNPDQSYVTVIHNDMDWRNRSLHGNSGRKQNCVGWYR